MKKKKKKTTHLLLLLKYLEHPFIISAYSRSVGQNSIEHASQSLAKSGTYGVRSDRTRFIKRFYQSTEATRIGCAY